MSVGGPATSDRNVYLLGSAGQKLQSIAITMEIVGGSGAVPVPIFERERGGRPLGHRHSYESL